MSDIRPKIYRFGLFEIDLEERRLSRAGDSVPLTPKAFETLAVLVERRGKVVDKAELLKLVWPDTFVEENNLNQNISALRKAFGSQDALRPSLGGGTAFSGSLSPIRRTQFCQVSRRRRRLPWRRDFPPSGSGR